VDKMFIDNSSFVCLPVANWGTGDRRLWITGSREWLFAYTWQPTRIGSVLVCIWGK